MIADPKRKPHQDEGDGDKRRRQEKALDEALENTFPASDPVSVEQPTTSGRAYYNESRTHLSLNKDAPVSRAIERLGAITSQPVLGGLHHQYCRI